jgi:hypothetical protein
MHGSKVLFSVAVLLLGGWPLIVAAQDADELARAREAWQRADIADYEYGYNKYCECHGESPPETLVTVTSGRVTNVRHRREEFDREVPAAAKNLQFYWTVPDLFDLLEAALEREAIVRFRFDSALGYPTSVYIDYAANTVGDEVDVRITRFEAR